MNDKILRRIPFDGIFNFRNLGGYAAAEGMSTKYGVIYRCGWVSELSDGDMARIRALGIKTVIDLRGEFELTSKPNGLSREDDIDVVNVDLLAELDPASVYNLAADDPEFIPGLYIRMIDSCGPKIAEFFRALAKGLGRGAVLFHCSAGKDRTGMMAMFLLSLVGVDELDITADYEVSKTYIAHVFKMAKESMSSSAEHVIRAMRYLDDNHGGAVGYLKKFGVTQEDIATIKRSFLEG